MTLHPKTKLDDRYSEPGVSASEWSHAADVLESAQLYWISTVRPEGRPHVAPLVGLWFEDGFYFCTGPAERKALNMASNSNCVITTGTNSFVEGFDVVVEGNAERISETGHLQRIADVYLAKYGSVWKYTVRDGGFTHGDGSIREVDETLAHVFQIKPVTAFGFGKGPFSQTRWRFTT